MSLTGGLNMAIQGMMTTSVRTTVSSQNITNADKEGYTRKNLEPAYLTTNIGSAPVSGVIVGSNDRFLVQSVISDTSAYKFYDTMAASLDYYASKFGSTDGNGTLSSTLDKMYSALQYLANNPETNANKAQVVQIADTLASGIRALSIDIQHMRSEADQNIATSVSNINSMIDEIDSLNHKMSGYARSDLSMAEYEDRREYLLQQLSQEMSIQYFYTEENSLQIYLENGQNLLSSIPQHLSYTPVNQVNGSIVYPAGFSPISLNGNDITTRISGGKLGAFIELRDTTYVDEQSKLDEFATVLKTEINTLLNTGASIPPPNTMVGSLESLTGASAFTATGTIRVAVTDRAGLVQAYSDINLAAMTTVNDVLTALNGVTGVTATLTADGELSIQASPSTSGIAINPLTSSVTSSTGESFSQYFGLNDLFTGTGAEDIKVSNALLTQPDILAISVLSNSATLAVGDRGVNRGDGTIADALAELLNSNVSFNTAGDFAAQNNSLMRYMQSIITNGSSKALFAQRNADTAQQILSSTTDLLGAQTGVNIDEETAKLLILQNQYQAGAQVISTIKDMMDALIAAVR